MPLCSKCRQNEATIHFTVVVNGAEDETVHLCKDCAPANAVYNLDPKELEALSVVGKKCEFCGRKAFSGAMSAGTVLYWCFDCGLEFGRILAELCASERPDLMQRSKEESSFLSFCFDPELQAWGDAANQKAAQILRDRRQQDGRDKGSQR